MRERRWGRIINLSSVAAQTGGILGPHYAASKAGVLGLTSAYAALLAKEGITVNAIAPALIETEMTKVNHKAHPDLIPVGRMGTVEETAEVVVMLARNGYVTGQTINVNGGWYMSQVGETDLAPAKRRTTAYLSFIPLRGGLTMTAGTDDEKPAQSRDDQDPPRRYARSCNSRSASCSLHCAHLSSPSIWSPQSLRCAPHRKAIARLVRAPERNQPDRVWTHLHRILWSHTGLYLAAPTVNTASPSIVDWNLSRWRPNRAFSTGPAERP